MVLCLLSKECVKFRFFFLLTEIPYNEFYDYFAPTYRLSMETRLMTNMNTKSSLDAYM